MALRRLKKHLSIPLIVGNVVTYEACLELMDSGVDALLIGVGPGAACTSREVLGLPDRIGVMFRGQLVAVLDGPTADREDVGLLMATGGRGGGGVQPQTLEEEAS